ncbi:MAG: hypothetical protein KC656_05870 [Myxococcales bacterium]|nr:hypothetical protein [Myxococcales bacterium]MCB9669220.1 hypothetical protein [Alphaproteobacteria bacterium]
MDASTQKQTSAAIGMAALVLALVVSVPSGIVGFATGYGASRSGSGSVHTVVHTTQQPAPQAPAWSFSNNDPDWLEDPDAMASLPERIAGRVAYAGRFKFLSVGTDKTVVAQVEVEGHGVDSVVFSWGQVIAQPVAMDAEEEEALEAQLFELTPDRLRRLPALVDAAIDAHPTGTVVDRVNILPWPDGRGSTEARIQISLTHPRKVIEPMYYDLDGRPIAP